MTAVLERVVFLLVLLLASIVVLGVAFRKAGAALPWYDEVAPILIVWLTYYAAPLVALKRGHIGVPTLVKQLSGRVRIAAILVSEAVVVAFFIVLAWAGMKAQSSLAGSTLVSLPIVPASLAQSVIPIGAALFVAAQLLSLPRTLRDGA